MGTARVTGGGARGRAGRQQARRQRLLTRTLPLISIAAVSFGAGLYVAGASGRSERALVKRYLNDWVRGDFAGMYSQLSPASQKRISETAFAGAYQAAASTATVRSLVRGRIGSRHGGFYSVAMTARTRLFGTLTAPLLVPVTGSGSDARISYGATLMFPGLRPGEQLTRRTVLAARGGLLASDGTPLAQGPGRTSPIPAVAGEIVGVVGPVPPDQGATYAAEGYPPGAQVGLDGLERVFQRRLAGRIGGLLFAGRRVLASVPPVSGKTVRTTINPTIEQAAITAMAGRYAGIAVMDPRTGALLALAGVAFSALQPPGSTMKIVTATGALEAGIVTLGSSFPVSTSATLDGYTLENANGEACGGTLLNAFAVSCNSVFAPLGARLGGAKLVNVAERFGFNQVPPLAGAAEATIPPASAIGDALAVGSSAIGQGEVQATTLTMTDVAATIAMRGRRPVPTLLYGSRPRFRHVTSARIAALVQQMMIAVVRYGTGTSAAIPGIVVAGKTGTAELRNTVQPPGSSTTTTPNTPPPNSPANTDAWFVGYAPVGAPRIVVGALFPAQGAGGATAAPAVHDVMVAALQAHR